MATASSPDMSYRVSDLLARGFDEDRQLAQTSIELVGEVMAKLRPNLKYVTHPVPLIMERHCNTCGDPNLVRQNPVHHVLTIGSHPDNPVQCLLLSETEGLIAVRRCPDGRFHFLHNQAPWASWPFDFFFSALTRAYEEAERKKQESWEATKARREMIQRIRDMLQGK